MKVVKLAKTARSKMKLYNNQVMEKKIAKKFARRRERARIVEKLRTQLRRRPKASLASLERRRCHGNRFGCHGDQLNTLISRIDGIYCSHIPRE